MKKLSIIWFLLFSITINNSLLAQNLQAFFSYAKFLSSETGPYLEIYLAIDGNSIVYTKNDPGKFQGAIEVSLMFKQRDTIRYFDKYNLLSPEIISKDSSKTNFIDQQRIPLPNGVYDFEIQIADKNKSTTDTVQDNSVSSRGFNHREVIIMDFSENIISLSDIELVESYNKSTKQNILTKSGYDLLPYITNFFPQSINKLIFYAEAYNSRDVLGADGKYLINYYIETYENKIPFNRYKRFIRQTAKDVNVIFNEFSIEELPSGNYNLVIEVRDRENKLLTNKKIFFQRSNSSCELNIEDYSAIDVTNTFVDNITDKDTLAEYIRSLAPISSKTEKIFTNNQIKTSDLEMMQRFFLHFWNKRNNIDPENLWKKYLNEVNKVNDQYGTRIKKGYETDRGRIYLQYGLPNSISKVDHEPNSYPYEIWHYYKIEDQTNVKFVFLDTDLAINDYTLIHSNAIGEINDPSWQYQTQKRDTPFNNIDILEAPDHYGGKAKDYYQNPR
ncbi:MAG: GWxTD domain-containing protein [Bacteroidota bacterium]